MLSELLTVAFTAGPPSPVYPTVSRFLLLTIESMTNGSEKTVVGAKEKVGENVVGLTEGAVVGFTVGAILIVGSALGIIDGTILGLAVGSCVGAWIGAMVP